MLKVSPHRRLQSATAFIKPTEICNIVQHPLDGHNSGSIDMSSTQDIAEL